MALVVPLLASPARAQIFVGESPYRTAENWALELRMGPYRPDVDSEFPGEVEGPHERYFGRKRPLMFQIELDRELWSGFGTVSVGAQVGYTRQTGSSFAVNATDATGQPARTGDKTTFTLVPTSLLLVYRLDVAARRWSIPFIPYAKVGLDYVLYWIRNGNDSVAVASQGGKGSGATTGWTAAVGLQLMLDVFDRGAARELDSTLGVNHTYLFGELVHHEDKGLFGGDQLHVGTTTWFAGLMFEF